MSIKPDADHLKLSSPSDRDPLDEMSAAFGPAFGRVAIASIWTRFHLLRRQPYQHGLVDHFAPSHQLISRVDRPKLGEIDFAGMPRNRSARSIRGEDHAPAHSVVIGEGIDVFAFQCRVYHAKKLVFEMRGADGADQQGRLARNR